MQKRRLSTTSSGRCSLYLVRTRSAHHTRQGLSATRALELTVKQLTAQEYQNSSIWLTTNC